MFGEQRHARSGRRRAAVQRNERDFADPQGAPRPAALDDRIAALDEKARIVAGNVNGHARVGVDRLLFRLPGAGRGGARQQAIEIRHGRAVSFRAAAAYS